MQGCCAGKPPPPKQKEEESLDQAESKAFMLALIAILKESDVAVVKTAGGAPVKGKLASTGLIEIIKEEYLQVGRPNGGAVVPVTCDPGASVQHIDVSNVLTPPSCLPRSSFRIQKDGFRQGHLQGARNRNH